MCAVFPFSKPCRFVHLVSLLIATIATAPSSKAETPVEALERLIAGQKIINAHEHAENLEVLKDAWFEVTKRAGFNQTVLVGSSKFTLTMVEAYGFTGYDENNENLLRIQQAHPDRFQAWPTLNPEDPEKYSKIVNLLERGAKGVKLYSGHGYVRRDTGEYMFHPIALDDPSMFPLYAYFEEHHVPLCFHVNPFKKGFAQELVEVLKAFPDMKVNIPHFMLSSINDSRLREYLNTFPNTWSDISFGHDDFLKAGLKRISRNPAKFRGLFRTFPDRFLFGSDLVLTVKDQKSADWCMVRIQAYYDMLTRETYTTPLLPETTLNGLALEPELLENILYKNFERFMAAEPEGTTITREIRWRNMGKGVVPNRYPGQIFPPKSDD